MAPCHGQLETAETLVRESFQYESGSLGTQNGGTGFLTAWAGTYPGLVAGDLGLDFPASMELAGAGGRTETPANQYVTNSPAAQRQVVASAAPVFNADGVLYFSYLFRTSGTGFSYLQMRDSAQNTRFEVGITSNNAYSAKIGGAAAATLSADNTYVANTTVLLVAKLVTVAGGDDTITLNWYVDGSTVPAAEPVTWSLTHSFANDSPAVNDRLVIQSSRFTAASFDEIRVGTTWESVATVQPAVGTAYEGFVYPTGSLGGQNGGSGFFTAWAGTYPGLVFGDQGLNYPTSMNLIGTGGRTETPVNTYGENSPSGQRQIAPSLAPVFTSDSTRYFSYLLRTSGTGFSYLQMRDSAQNTRFEVGITSNNAYSARIGGGTATLSADNAYLANTTVLLVAKLVTQASGDDTISLNWYANGDSVPSTEPETWNLVHSFDNASPARNDRLLIQSSRFTAASFDEIRVGTTWESVVPVQTPTNTFANWIAGFDVGAQTGFKDDPDNDGLANALENILGSSPDETSNGITLVSASGGNLSFRHTLSATPADDLAASYEWSVDLASWNASGATANGTTVSFGTPAVITPGTPDLVEVTATVTGTPVSKVFARLKVIQSSP
jgi:hypothetical protein